MGNYQFVMLILICIHERCLSLIIPSTSMMPLLIPSRWSDALLHVVNLGKVCRGYFWP